MPQFLTKVQEQNRVEVLSGNDRWRADQNVCKTLSHVMKANFTITILRRSVKIKFELQEIIHCQPKFLDNVLFATTFFFMKFGFNTIIPLENDKRVTAKWYTEEYLSNILKQVKKHRRPNDLLIYYQNASSHKITQTNGIFRSSTH